ncbi:hypothetical protein WR25_12332 [Diploscapter pachys]|uniref:Uncharacterized protein n=1 Tax=Diploscapter pachys TaxID=2018661 RepID=A0A2A2LBJ8_9BILA|nr:hypothetical protein WR25_12332 [Diploscapter pachys]
MMHLRQFTAALIFLIAVGHSAGKEYGPGYVGIDTNVPDPSTYESSGGGGSQLYTNNYYYNTGYNSYRPGGILGLLSGLFGRNYQYTPTYSYTPYYGYSYNTNSYNYPGYAYRYNYNGK